jgi:outer membrane biosynthesis protein TonB
MVMDTMKKKKIRFFNPARAAIAVVSVAAALMLAGCKSKTPAAALDPELTAQVQGRIASDPNLSGQTIQAAVAGGVVTLNGAVTSNAARTIASQDAAQVAGVKSVVDNLVVSAPPTTTAVTAPPPLVPEKIKKPSAMVAKSEPPPPPAPAPIVRDTPPPPPAPAPLPEPTPVVAQAPPPPPTPTVHNITLPAGTDIPVRITETLDSASTQAGDRFTGAIASDIVVDNLVVLPQGTPVTGHVDAAQDAAHFKGGSLLTISLSAINRKGDHIEVATDPYTKQGEGRGKNTAEKVGGGAAVGAILGGILGGGRGAAIGSAAGAGVGAGAQGVTRGQQVQIVSETVVRFRLSDAIIVRVTSGAGSSGNTGAALERHTDP